MNEYEIDPLSNKCIELTEKLYNRNVFIAFLLAFDLIMAVVLILTITFN